MKSLLFIKLILDFFDLFNINVNKSLINFNNSYKNIRFINYKK